MECSGMPPSDDQQHVDFLRLYVADDEAPREARSVVISLASGRLQNNDEKTPHYLDDVRAHLLIGPHATHIRKRRR